MAGGHKVIVVLSLLLGLLHNGSPQTLPESSQNFCASNPSQPDDNLSCPGFAFPGVICLPREAICNGFNDCNDGNLGSDEGDGNFFFSNFRGCKSTVYVSTITVYHFVSIITMKK